MPHFILRWLFGHCTFAPTHTFYHCLPLPTTDPFLLVVVYPLCQDACYTLHYRCCAYLDRADVRPLLTPLPRSSLPHLAPHQNRAFRRLVTFCLNGGLFLRFGATPRLPVCTAALHVYARSPHITGVVRYRGLVTYSTDHCTAHCTTHLRCHLRLTRLHLV